MSSKNTQSSNSSHTQTACGKPANERLQRGLTKKVTSYFKSYAEPESQGLFSIARNVFSASFILPIFDEPIEALECFLALPVNDGVRSVWVFNAPENCSDDARQRTQDALSHFKNRLAASLIFGNVYEAHLSDFHHLILVDRCSVGRAIPPEKGVGLARKIGADIAVALATQTLPSSENHVSQRGAVEPSVVEAPHWLYFCDADVRLPSDYFDQRLLTNNDNNCAPSAYIFPFEHCPDPGVELETELYDFKLRYYVEQLARAGSTYAYHALGSVMVVNSVDYIAVRGVPTRAAGEDFYLLNKLNKLNGVCSLTRPAIEIAGRLSARVPFGTGPAIEQLSKTSDVLQEYRYYHPLIFQELAWLLNTQKALAASSDALSRSADQGAADQSVCSIAALWEEMLSNNERIKSVLAELRVDRFIEHCRRQNVNAKRFQKAFNDWFDALATLRFVHLMRDRYYPNLSLSDIEKAAPHLSDDLASRCKKILFRGSP